MIERFRDRMRMIEIFRCTICGDEYPVTIEKLANMDEPELLFIAGKKLIDLHPNKPHSSVKTTPRQLNQHNALPGEPLQGEIIKKGQ
jgi:predicted metal-binding protein